MKHLERIEALAAAIPFSALGRAVWDETIIPAIAFQLDNSLSVLSVEPYGMKPLGGVRGIDQLPLSVLSVEPYGMKPVV